MRRVTPGREDEGGECDDVQKRRPLRTMDPATASVPKRRVHPPPHPLAQLSSFGAVCPVHRKREKNGNMEMVAPKAHGQEPGVQSPPRRAMISREDNRQWLWNKKHKNVTGTMGFRVVG